MQVLTNGVWADLPLDRRTEGSNDEVHQQMVAHGYSRLATEIGASDWSAHSVRVWSSESKKVQPEYVFQVCIGNTVLTLGAATFADYISLLERMTAMVHNAIGIDLMDELVHGETDIFDLAQRIRRHLG